MLGLNERMKIHLLEIDGKRVRESIGRRRLPAQSAASRRFPLNVPRQIDLESPLVCTQPDVAATGAPCTTCAVVIAASNAANAYVMRYRAVARYHYRRESDDLCRAAGIRALCALLASSSLARSLTRDLIVSSGCHCLHRDVESRASSCGVLFTTGEFNPSVGKESNSSFFSVGSIISPAIYKVVLWTDEMFCSIVMELNKSFED